MHPILVVAGSYHFDESTEEDGEQRRVFHQVQHRVAANAVGGVDGLPHQRFAVATQVLVCAALRSATTFWAEGRSPMSLT